MTSTHVLEREQIIARPRLEVFEFFADARNLEVITPEFLNFRILTPTPIEMKEGALIDYRIRLFGVPVNWRTRIDVYEPGVRFVDRQLRGPYRTWIHTHEFTDVDGGRATKMVDRVEYEVPFGPIGGVARALFVRRTLDRIFDHRAKVIELTIAPPVLRRPA
jgi:ligand-binding SRPBCC domain-containing protein